MSACIGANLAEKFVSYGFFDLAGGVGSQGDGMELIIMVSEDFGGGGSTDSNPLIKKGSPAFAGLPC